MRSSPMTTFPVKATYQTRLPESVSPVLSRQSSDEIELIKGIRKVLLESQGVKFYER